VLVALFACKPGCTCQSWCTISNHVLGVQEMACFDPYAGGPGGPVQYVSLPTSLRDPRLPKRIDVCVCSCSSLVLALPFCEFGDSTTGSH
jgi:hypothetical protein